MSKNQILLDRLKQRKAEVEKLASGLSDEQFTQAPADGGWSFSQVVNHIMISEIGTNAYVNKKLQGLDSIPKAGIKNQLNSKALKLALKSPKKFKAPKVLPDPENKGKEETFSNWSKNREALYATFEGLPIESLDKEMFKHPVAGYFTPEQTLHFLADHIKHHLPQINRIINSL